jgi:hypothetical protein
MLQQGLARLQTLFKPAGFPTSDLGTNTEDILILWISMYLLKSYQQGDWVSAEARF